MSELIVIHLWVFFFFDELLCVFFRRHQLLNRER